jgi:hypothetical protein
MMWGICVGDGWYKIIDDLCGAIQDRCDNVTEYKHTAWGKILHSGKIPFWAYRILLRLPFSSSYATRPLQIECTQLKEKYGTLRFYINGGDDEIYGMISLAEYQSAHTCEHCGEPGELRDNNWIRCECDKHVGYRPVWNPNTEEYESTSK